jgi:hypothetical protein
MKHIKNFNESNKEEYYQEVGREEWDSFQPLDISEKFYKRINSEKALYQDSYYKCDQWEGLLMLLKDKKVI